MFFHVSSDVATYSLPKIPKAFLPGHCEKISAEYIILSVPNILYFAKLRKKEKSY